MVKKDGLDYERVPFADFYHSAVQGPHKPVQAVIRNEGDLTKLLPDTPLPAVDFSGNQLIVVALGDKPTSGYDVRITGVTYFTDRLKGRPPLISVAYTDTEKGGPFDQIYKPIHVVSTRRMEGEVEFEKNVEH